MAVLGAVVALGGAGTAVAGIAASPVASGATHGTVLLVGSYRGHRGQYSTIQAAVDAAHPGDWVLVAPGDYHEGAGEQGPDGAQADDGDFGGVLITTPDLHLRGMDRSTVVVDGTKPGAPACSVAPGDQNFGANAAGRNGIVVFKANGVTVQNLTVCNFMAGTGSSGNQIWWNGGAESGKVGLHGFSGSYLTATSTYFGGESTAATYGLFASNSSTGSWDRIYASNMNDSGMYVGACQQQCNMLIDHAWMEYSALGYSGTNSGGQFVVEHSQFDNNLDGFDTNTQINGDPPAPQNGACPHGGTSPITHTHSCWVFMHNYSHDNNNPNVPAAGSAAGAPTGTGMSISGGHNDTVMDNVFANNGAWGAVFVPYPDSGTPSLHQVCSKATGTEVQGLGCVFDPENDALLHNTFQHNGYFGNPGNADFAQITFEGGQPQNCYVGNEMSTGSWPTDLEQTQHTCGTRTKAANTAGALLGQMLCDTGFGSCPAGASYPKLTAVVMHPLPKLSTMPDPCRGVPANAWCPAKSS